VVLRFACPRLFARSGNSPTVDGRFTRLFRTLVKADLLILDDWGPDRLTANQRARSEWKSSRTRHGKRLHAYH